MTEPTPVPAAAPATVGVSDLTSGAMSQAEAKAAIEFVKIRSRLREAVAHEDRLGRDGKS